ncbi:MAG: helix-turn-helix domain-containing protein [Defluviitaleaceae bacterium]|nr:helix-turn-helix domain-containing protein [Defluviitaleaceae bacterium]
MFAERLRELRLSKKITQAELARRLDIRRDLYNKYERTGVMPPHTTLAAIAEILETTIDFLLTGKSYDDDEFEGLEFAFYNDFKVLTDEHKEQIRTMAKILRQMEAKDK